MATPSDSRKANGHSIGSSAGIQTSTLAQVLAWARADSLSYLAPQSGCCADELLNTAGCRYDLERFGCLPQVDPRQADLLIVTGALSYKAATYLYELYQQMLHPKYVLALGSCSSGGGAFAPHLSYSIIAGADRIVPVDVYVPGCPPRPESIMNGLIALQEKIRGKITQPSE